ncbi:uncharacterized protein [Triticum aestivum]|uniref:uncharacterized protein n=2 Tax=Triticum TaxID=4564 RepID=UPI001D00A3FA|nr:uncharacterized protein LOC123110717 [Triticum aestivum]XP_044387243.1 uncharacterized protein LOC123110717 [Triticum aestivum]
MSDQRLEAESVLAGGEAQPALLEPYARLVRLVVRAFYDDLGFQGEELITGCAGEAGLAVVLLDALTRCRCQWVEEEELAKVLKLNKRKCLQILHYFEAERFLKRKIPKICDITRYKISMMKANLKNQLANKVVESYTCCGCKRRYSVFDAMQLGSFECESCSRELVREGDEESNDASRDGRKRRKTNLSNKLQRIQEQLEPLASLLDMIEKLPALEFLYLYDDDLPRSSGHDAVRVLGEKMVEASPALNRMPDPEKHINLTESKILPDWMIREGMLQKNTHTGDDSALNESTQDAYAKAYRQALYEAYSRDTPAAVRR